MPSFKKEKGKIIEVWTNEEIRSKPQGSISSSIELTEEERENQILEEEIQEFEEERAWNVLSKKEQEEVNLFSASEIIALAERLKNRGENNGF